MQIEDRVAIADHPIDPLLGAGLAARRGSRRPRLQIPLVEVSRGVERSGRRQEDLEAKARGLAGREGPGAGKGHDGDGLIGGIGRDVHSAGEQCLVAEDLVPDAISLANSLAGPAGRRNIGVVDPICPAVVLAPVRQELEPEPKAHISDPELAEALMLPG